VPAISTARKILYTAIVLGAVLGVCEAALRVRAWIRYGGWGATVRDPMLTYDPGADLFVPTPGYEAQGGRIHIRINSLGFRGDEFAREKPSGTIRIAVLGASTTFNAEVSSNHATWPHRLQEKLRTAHPGLHVEVINAAVGGYVAIDNLKSLRHRVLPLRPDLVIYYEANNEIVKDTRELAKLRGLTTGEQRSSIVAGVTRYSLLADLAHKNLAILTAGRGRASGTLDELPPDLPSGFIRQLDAMRQELNRADVPFMLSTFIVKYRRGQDRETQIRNADVAFFYMPWMSIDGMLQAMDLYNQAILEYAAKHDLPVVDDRDAIPPDAEHFTDCMHLADRGADVMADRFARYFTEHRIIEQLQAGRMTVSGYGVPVIKR
jgi:lysophospholipase L1-like esterase